MPRSRVPASVHHSHRCCSWSTLVLLAAVSACGGTTAAALPPKTTKAAKPPPAVVAASVAPEPALVPLRTGALEPIVDAKVSLGVVARREVGEDEILEIALPPFPGSDLEVAPEYLWLWTTVELSSGPARLAFVGVEEPPVPARAAARGARAAAPAVPRPTLHLWVRRPKSAGPLEGMLYTPAGPIGESGRMARGHRVPFSVGDVSGAPVASALERTWASALANHFDRQPGPFYRFAASRVRERFLGAKATAAGARNPSRSSDDLRTLMDTMTGRLSIQEALQRDRALYLAVQRQAEIVPIGRLHPPALTVHPWAELSKALRTAVPQEPLANATPAEFYFVRARSLGQLLDVVDLVDGWGQPAADVLDGRAEERGTFARYQDELGLERTALTRALGGELVSDLALVGSDPYVHEGTDVTLLLHATHPALLETALAGVVQAVATAHGGVTETTFAHEGVSVAVLCSRDGSVRQHRATVGDLVIVSNSPGAMRRVLSTIHGNHPRLSDEPDFLYMLARDAADPGELLGYMGDRFVASVVGPAQKIAEARRQMALAELSVPGYAALLSGFLNGASPSTSDDLVRAGLLERTELRHASGGKIEFQPGQAARSEWGSLPALVPLIDRPDVARVTEAERASYESFARSYESLWSDKIDPVAVRVARTSPDHPGLTVDLRVLPLLRSEYRDLSTTAGDARLIVPALPSGLRFVLGIGENASIRKELSQEGRSFAGQRLALDWIGDYALLGLTNRNELANAAHQALSEDIEAPADGTPPRATDEVLLANAPVYAAVAVKSRLGATVALSALREIAREAAPGVAVWDTAAAYRGNEVVKIGIRERQVSVALYYSLLENALVVSLNEASLHEAIDRLLDAPPSSVPERSLVPRQAAQALLELSGDKTTVLYRVAAWLATTALDKIDGSAPIAEAVLRGAPEIARSPERVRELMKRYFGVIALTADGRDYELAPEGVKDPVRGTANAPIWPELPVPGSAIDRVLSRLGRLQTALSFDTEPGSPPGSVAPLQSLHAHVEIGLR